MILFFDNNKKIIKCDYISKKEEYIHKKNTAWYEGEFSFLDGENKEGFQKVFKWDGEKPIVEYVEIQPEPELEPTQLDRIEAAANMKNADIAQAAIDEYTLELVKEGVL